MNENDKREEIEREGDHYLFRLLARAAEDNSIVVFGPPGMDMDTVLEAMQGHIPNRFVIVADAPQTPGDKNVLLN